MPAEQRIIGGGLLLTGVAVVLILLYFFAFGGASAKDAYDTLVSDIHPAYQKAREQRDYLTQRRQASAAIDLLKDAGETAVLKHLAADASSGDKMAQTLQALIKDDVFKNNADGKYKFNDAWFTDTEHRALSGLDAAISELKELRTIRITARETADAIAAIGVGSGMTIELPPAKTNGGVGPTATLDAEAYRVFSVSTDAIKAALDTPVPPAGRAKTARIRWNKSRAASSLGKDVAALPERADALSSAAASIQAYGQTLRSQTATATAVAALLKTGLSHAAAGLSPEARRAFDAGRDTLDSIVKLADYARGQAALVKTHRTVRDLGRLLGQSFKE